MRIRNFPYLKDGFNRTVAWLVFTDAVCAPAASPRVPSNPAIKTRGNHRLIGIDNPLLLSRPQFSAAQWLQFYPESLAQPAVAPLATGILPAGYKLHPRRS